MATRNDITGDEIKSKVSNQEKYEDGWDRIFGNKNKKSTTEETPPEEVDK